MRRPAWICEWPSDRSVHDTEADAMEQAQRKVKVGYRHAVVYEIELEDA